ncbi:Retrovirus-related Pol polyprotein from transposon [Sesamum alatum]|uniref:Retrovirus-related Pol polyprotein from transposon n=1 Tax=Sesamum alatum TaxID=300844 RepID=A0AAE2C818_9LAMI|nr:Retrovirus-related Pol polyprotein from transposon [Sesamum alatum]
MDSVLQILLDNSYFVKFSKCTFGASLVDYLGHVISTDRVAANPTKIQAISDWPTPVSLTALRAFLGLTGYYRRFVLRYASIASPLTDLLKNQAFQWSPMAASTFEALKAVMLHLLMPCLPNFSQSFDVTTDASQVAVGAVLSQNRRPIAFFSKKLGPRLQATSACEREMYAISEAVRKWRQENPVANALSHHPSASFHTFVAVSSTTHDILGRLCEFFSTHPDGQALISRLSDDPQLAL